MFGRVQKSKYNKEEELTKAMVDKINRGLRELRESQNDEDYIYSSVSEILEYDKTILLKERDDYMYFFLVPYKTVCTKNNYKILDLLYGKPGIYNVKRTEDVLGLENNILSITTCLCVIEDDVEIYSLKINTYIHMFDVDKDKLVKYIERKFEEHYSKINRVI